MVLLVKAERVTEVMGGGSSRPVSVRTAAGEFVTKVRGPGGVLELTAEWLGGALACRLGVPVPEAVLVELDAASVTGVSDPELREALLRSLGINLGFRRVTGAHTLTPRDTVAQWFAERVLWLDTWIENVDRTARNPNVLVTATSMWAIDHGAAFPFHQVWDVDEQAPGVSTGPSETHLFRARVPWPDPAFLKLALPRAELDSVCQSIPDALLASNAPFPSPERHRAAYAAYLWKRQRVLLQQLPAVP